MVTINPMVSIVLGITLFGDRLRSGPGWITLEVVGLAVLVVGVVVLARSPLVAGTGDAAGTAGAPGPTRCWAGRASGPPWPPSRRWWPWTPARSTERRAGDDAPRWPPGRGVRPRRLPPARAAPRHLGVVLLLVLVGPGPGSIGPALRKMVGMNSTMPPTQTQNQCCHCFGDLATPLSSAVSCVWWVAR